MQHFLHIIQSSNPSLSFLSAREKNITLSKDENQQFYDWLSEYIEKLDSYDLEDIKALALCRTSGAIHKATALRLYSVNLPCIFPESKLVNIISEHAQKTKQEVFLIGGCVRDLFLGKPFFDIDCCLEASPDIFVDALIQKHGGYYDKSLRFGAVHWHTVDGEVIDFTQTREETYPKKGQLPNVTPSTLEADLQRRDFSINAMAIPLHLHKIDQLIDPFHGISDLKNKILRILHPLSFWDDPTRIFRGARYAGRYNLQCATLTKQCLTFALSAIVLGKDISWQRIGQELTLIFQEPYPLLAWKKLEEWGVLAEWFPAWRQIHPLLEILSAEYSHPTAVEKLHSYWIILSLSLSTQERQTQIDMISQNKIIRHLWINTPLLLERLQQNNEKQQDRGDFAEIIQEASQAQLFALSLFLPELQHLFDWWKKEGSQISCKLQGKDLHALGCPRGPLFGKALSVAKRAAWNGLSFQEQIEEAKKVWLEAPP